MRARAQNRRVCLICASPHFSSLLCLLSARALSLCALILSLRALYTYVYISLSLCLFFPLRDDSRSLSRRGSSLHPLFSRSLQSLQRSLPGHWREQTLAIKCYSRLCRRLRGDSRSLLKRKARPLMTAVRLSLRGRGIRRNEPREWV